MARKKSRQDMYTGRSGQLAVMSELLYRGLNVAVPEVDVGDDVFVVRDEEADLTRVQVKSANARDTQAGFFAQFQVALAQLETIDIPPLVYVFAVRRAGRWEEFVIIRRAALQGLRDTEDVGSPDGQGNIILRLAFTGQDVRNKQTTFQAYRNAWDPWPPPPFES